MAVQVGRGWPAWELGEWEVMLVVESLVAGQPVSLPVGAVHGHGLGSYLMALVVLPLRWLGLSPLLAAKGTATVLGAITAGLCAGAAATLAGRRAGPRAAVLAAAIVAAVSSVSWPSLHLELGGVSGRTPDAILPCLAGALLILRVPPPGLLRTGGVGFLLGLAWILSPASIWLVGLALIATIFHRDSAPTSGERRWGNWIPDAGRRPTALLLGLALPVLLMALLLPSGFEGGSAFLHKQADQVIEALSGQAGTHPTAMGDRGPLRALAAVPAVLGTGGLTAGDAPFLVRLGLSHVGWIILIGGLLSLVLAWVARRWTTEAVLSLAGLSFIVPLGLVATGEGDLGAAARYFVVPLYLGLVGGASALGVGVVRFGRARWALGVLAVAWAMLPLTSLDRMLSSPSWTLQDSLMSTGAHGLPVFSGADRHSAFRGLLRGVPSSGRAAFIEGYGMDLGGEAAQELWGGTPPGRLWEELVSELPSKESSALLLGVGCGLGRLDVDSGVVRFVGESPPSQQRDLFYGLGLCAYDRTITHPSSVSVGVEDLARLSAEAREQLSEGREDAGRPFPRKARRSAVPTPAERMRALPPPGPRHGS